MDEATIIETIIGSSPYGVFTALGFLVAWRKDKQVNTCYLEKNAQSREYAEKLIELTVEVVKAIEAIEQMRTRREKR